MFKFEDKINEINRVIYSRKDFWKLKKLTYIGFEDVAQIILIHIYNNFDKWDQTRPIENWVSVIAQRQMINLMRDHYYRTVAPCYGCKMNLGGNDCAFTKSGKQCEECPLYKKWAKSKKNAYALKMATSLDEIYSEGVGTEFDMNRSVKEFHTVMLSLLEEKAAVLYKLLYIDCVKEDEAAITLGFKSNEKRKPGYKQICNLKRQIQETAQYVIKHYDVIK